MEALGPRDGNPVPLGRRDEAERHLLRRRAVALAVEVHLPAQLAVPAGVLARHVVHLLSRAGVDDDGSTGGGGGGGRRVEEGEDALPLAGIVGGGAGEGATA